MIDGTKMHGKWSINTKGKKIWIDEAIYECSVCESCQVLPLAYCPVCGAKMDGKIERNKNRGGK